MHRVKIYYPESLSRRTIGASYFLPQLVGQSMARELFFTGRKFDADEAQRIGLVSHVVPDDSLLAAATELAEEMAAKAPTALASMKRNLNDDNIDNDLEDSIMVEAMRIGPLLGGAENKEAATAFLGTHRPRLNLKHQLWLGVLQQWQRKVVAYGQRASEC